MMNSASDERRNAIAIVVCLVIVMVYTEIVFAPYRTPVIAPSPSTSDPVKASSVPLSPPTTNNTATAPTTPRAEATAPGLEALALGGRTTLVSSTYKTSIVHLGGRIESFALTNYRQTLQSSTPYPLIQNGDYESLPLGIIVRGGTEERDDWVQYRLAHTENGAVRQATGEITVSDEAQTTLTFEGTLPSGRSIVKRITFLPDSYVVRVSYDIPDADRKTPTMLEWTYYDPKEKHDPRTDFHGAILLTPQGLERAPFGSDFTPVRSIGAWAGISDSYFLSSIVSPESSPAQFSIDRERSSYRLRGETYSLPAEFSLFLGPKDIEILKQSGGDLHRAVDLGWFAVIAHPLLSFLRILHGFFGNWGLAIISLTLVIKALFLPLNKKSFESMQAMQAIQPELQALRERIKDPTVLQQETMELFKKHNVNPLGGCLPMLIQIPVFLGLYNVLLYAIELRHAPFALWINDLSAPESLTVGGIGLPIMALLMGASMVVQQWMTPSTMDPLQRKIMLAMPIVFTFVFISFPSGLVLYWLVNNLISIVQQFYIRNRSSLSPTVASLVASGMLLGGGYVLTLL